MNEADQAAPASAFHPGELALQSRAGMRERLEQVGPKVIRDRMPEQHRQFFAQLPLLILAARDDRGRPWVSPLVGSPGFVHSPDPRRLRIRAHPPPGDPLAGALRPGAAVGLLGLEFHTRRRNRVNGRLAPEADGGGFTLEVEQSFGNCPQYIQARLHRPLPPPAEPLPPRRLHGLDAPARAIVECADTFFIATHCGDGIEDRRHGADASHRGGRPGFVQVLDERTLRFPDYRGNFYFNTLGNILHNPRCGLLFLDFASGDTLQLTGEAEILFDWADEDPALAGAQRLVRFVMEDGVHSAGAVPLAWEFLSYAPQLAPA